jgi:hypothetical protein
MCEKCETKRERLNKLLNEDEVLNDGDQRGTLATFAAVAIEKVLEEVGNDPYAAESVLRKLLGLSVARHLQKMLKDPKVQAEMKQMRAELEDKMSEKLLQGIPDSKMIH